VYRPIPAQPLERPKIARAGAPTPRASKIDTNQADKVNEW
jgi:hypothetical protein